MASIIGGGFLVSVPPTTSAAGVRAIEAVVLPTALADLIGGAIRSDVRHAERFLPRSEPGQLPRSPLGNPALAPAPGAPFPLIG